MQHGRGDTGVGRDHSWEECLQSFAFVAAALCLQFSNAFDGTKIVIARNQKLVEIQKIWKHFVLNRATESKDFRGRIP